MRLSKKSLALKCLSYTFLGLFMTKGNGGPTLPPPYFDMNIPSIGQSNKNLCWAAVLTMAINFNFKKQPTRPLLTQCEVVNQGLVQGSSINCCGNDCAGISRISDCTNRLPVDPFQKIESILRKNNLKVEGLSMGNNSLLGALKRNIRNSNPVIIITGPRPSHVLLVTGFDESSGKTLLLINNPLDKNYANCKSCRHVLQISENGKNVLCAGQISDYECVGGNGTYNPVKYLAVSRL